MTYDVVIVGGGLAGLCCARHLARQKINYLLLEASDAVGGRVRTDRHEGFLLDRGFQVLLDSYPEAHATLDIPALRLQPFLPGARIRFGGRFHDLTDPWRRPWKALRTLVSPIGTLADKLRVARLRSHCLRGHRNGLSDIPETTSLEMLQKFGFSSSLIERFFRPFLGGIFLDRKLQTSSRMLDFVFRMFSLGQACLPAEGMEAIARQLANQVPPDGIRVGMRVQQVQAGRVTLAGGDVIEARSVVVAVEGPEAARLLGADLPARGQGVTCLYFAAPKPPVAEPILVLNGDAEGPINNLCVPTIVAPTYGSGQEHLVSVTVLDADLDNDRLTADVRAQLANWFGPPVKDWRYLRTYRIPYALPVQSPPALSVPQRSVRWQPGLYVCGDHRDNASIQGAMVSGRRAAEALIADRS